MSSSIEDPSLINKSNKRRSVDIVLTAGGKALATGETVSFRLVKGPPLEKTKDPVEANKGIESFPIVAKFPEASVVIPKFGQKPWNTGRLYQQDIPKAVDSDEEGEKQQKQPKKRWRYNNQAPRRQWILQEEVDYLETMIALREKKGVDDKKLSSRYVGQPEHNPSKYICLMPSSELDSNALAVRTLAGFVTFSQPAARKTYSLSEAEQAIQDQRMGLTMHHLIDDKDFRRPALLAGSKKTSSRARLLGKLKAKEAGEEDDDDDIMGDVAFRNRKGGSRAARKEILSTLGEGLTVSDEGVIGGTDDQVFGGSSKFGNFQKEEKNQNDMNTSDTKVASEEKNADGLAMADDFYQRDVQAEYDELDYDANEQFDDDDVDLGEGEVNVNAEDLNADEFDQELDELDVDDEQIGGAEGLASVAGLKEMLAKARGESPVVVQELKRKETHAHKKDTEDDKMAKIMAASEESRTVTEVNMMVENESQPKTTGIEAAPLLQKDEHGQRIITLDSVRREIWLNHGSIATKRLMKIFDIKKKSSAERQESFRRVIKELCTMVNDPVNGRMLVLKQHYSNMA